MRYITRLSALLFLSVTAVSGLSGCASNGASNGASSDTPMMSEQGYRLDRSGAWNQAHAAGLTGVEDLTISGSTRRSTAVAMAMSQINQGHYNAITWQAMGVDRTKEFQTKGNAPETKNHLFAWMPLDQADSVSDAHKLLLSKATEAVTRTMERGQMPHFVKTDGSRATIFFSAQDWKCPAVTSRDNPGVESCRVTIHIAEPEKTLAPEFLIGQEGDRYAFTPNTADARSYIELELGENSKAHEIQFYEAVSEELPNYSFLYIAPGQVQNFAGVSIPFPYILHLGNLMPFIISENL